MAFNPQEYLKSSTATLNPQQSTFNPKEYVGKNKVESIWKRAGLELTNEQIAAHPYLAATQKTLQESFTLPYEFFNQMALGYPGKILEEKLGLTVPTGESKGAQFARGAGGILGALKSPIFKAFGGAPALLKAPLKTKALVGGLQMAAYPTQKGMFNLAEKPGQFVTGAALGAGIPVAGKAIQKVWRGTLGSPKSIEWLARNVSQITDFTKNTVARLKGKVFQPEYYAEDYVGSVFAPKVKDSILSSVSSYSPNLKKRAMAYGIGADDFDIMGKVSDKGRKLFASLISRSPLRRGAAQEAANNMIGAAKENIDNVMVAQTKPVNITTTVRKIEKFLKTSGMVKQQGAAGYRYAPAIGGQNQTVNNIINTYDWIRNNGLTKINPRTKVVKFYVENGQRFQQALQELEGYIEVDPKRSRLILPIIDALKADARNPRTGILGYERVAKQFSDAQNLSNVAGRFDRLIDLERINAKFAGINADNAARKYQALRSFKSALSKELYDDLAAHYASRNFAPEFYPSLSGIRKLGITEFSKAYYKKFPTGMHLPAGVKKATEAMRKVTAPAVKGAKALGGATEEMLSEPYFSPQTKAGAQALLESKRGSVYIPGGKKTLQKQVMPHL